MKSLLQHLEARSNDYTFLESRFREEWGLSLLSKRTIPKTKFSGKHLPKISIIFALYNDPPERVKRLISSIFSQTLSTILKAEIVVVNDNPSNALHYSYVFSKAQKAAPKNFEFKFINNPKNLGVGRSKQKGVQNATGEVLFFLDSDIVLGTHFLQEHLARLLLDKKIVTVSFKGDAEKKDLRLSKAAEVPLEEINLDFSGDFRIKVRIKKEWVGLPQDLKVPQTVYCLKQSNFFKDFGNGKQIGVFTLPFMVEFHSTGIWKETFLKSGGFDPRFIGWGMQGVYVATKVIANGGLIIPVLSTGIIHEKHLPRSGTLKQRQLQLLKNIRTYNQLLSSPFNPKI